MYRLPKHIFDPAKLTLIILLSTLAFAFVLTVILSIFVILFDNVEITYRLFTALGALIYIGICLLLFMRQKIRIVAWMLIALYSLLGVFILSIWSINAPVGLLVFAFVIFLSGVLVGIKYILPVSGCVIFILIGLYVLEISGVTKPGESPFVIDSNLGSVVSYAVIFGIFSLIAWVSGRHLESIVNAAQRAEIKAEKQKHHLAEKLEERTRSLKEAQLGELRQLYHFAELGQFTTMILHELANYLSVLNLDIDDLKKVRQHDDAIDRAKESIAYLDKMISSVRQRLRSDDRYERIHVKATLKELVRDVNTRATKLGLKIRLIDNVLGPIYIHGDSLRLSQCIAILINNAMDALKHPQVIPTPSPTIYVEIDKAQLRRELRISVIDHGVGFSEEKRTRVFQPLVSSKAGGLGVGLYICKQIIETHFKGEILLNSRTDRTQFDIFIPLLKA